MVKISVVSYLNAKPFIYGLNHSFDFQNHTVSLDIPSVCARKLLDNEVDLGLIPVAAIPLLTESHIISNFCIGADGPVNTVMLYSEVPLEQIRSVFLDYQSRTSVNLVRVLANNYWKITPEWINATVGYEKNIKGYRAGLVIGDRAFDLNKTFPYEYDLALEWKKFTNLPFVFATWVANKKLETSFIDMFNKALQYGVSNLDLVLDSIENSLISRNILDDYFKRNISYNLNSEKYQALDLFLNFLKTDLYSTQNGFIVNN